MKWLIDNNVLFAAIVLAHPDHAAARAWLDRAKKDGWGLTVETFLGVVRKLMNPVAMHGSHMKANAAVDVLARELSGAHPGQIIIGGAPDNALLKKAQGHRQIMDIYLVQVARDTGVKLVTCDNGILAAFPAIAVHPS
jgi:predicted nucleic acid-binding protein